MSKPRMKDMRDLKRLGRYLIGRERTVTTFRRQEGVKVIDVWADTDYAGCTETRKSTSGGVVMLGQHVIKGWSNTQSVIALSSGEAEYYGLVRGTSIGIGIRSLMQDFGREMRVRTNTDSSAAVGYPRGEDWGRSGTSN